MQESKFLGGLLPSHPDYEPVIRSIREKYNLPEIYPQDDPVDEIFLDDKIISIEEFSRDVRKHILENLETMFPEDFVRKYKSSKIAVEADYQSELGKFSDEVKPTMGMFFEFTKNSAQTIYKILDANINEIVGVICNHLLLGEVQEAPQDWFGKVVTMNTGGETMIIAMASEYTNLDVMMQQVRDLHKKTFGARRVKITKGSVDTTYYLQLKMRGKDNDFILDEYIRLNKISLPRDKNSLRYVQIRKKVWDRLKKKMAKATTILNSYSGENN